MFVNFNLYIVALCAFLIATSAAALATQDSTNLQKMQESDFKAMDNINPLTVLTKGNLKETFAGLKVTVDNSGDYSKYHGDLHYKVIEHADSLAIQKYTPELSCSNQLYRRGKALCNADNEKFAGKTTIMCSFAKDAKSCTHSNGSFYELTLGGLLMGESYIYCRRVQVPITNSVLKCDYQQYPRRVYVWDIPATTQ